MIKRLFGVLVHAGIFEPGDQSSACRPYRLDQYDYHWRRGFHRGLLSDAALAGISETIKARAMKHLSGGSDQSSFWQGFHGDRTTRFTGLGRNTEYFFDLLEDPLFGTVADVLLADSGKGYWLNTCQAMIIGPGEPAQTLHRDGDNWANVQSAFWPNSPELTVSMMIALDDVWPALGSTRIVPGSHRWADYRRRPVPNEVVAGHFKAGDALLYTGSMLRMAAALTKRPINCDGRCTKCRGGLANAGRGMPSRRSIG